MSEGLPDAHVEAVARMVGLLDDAELPITVSPVKAHALFRDAGMREPYVLVKAAVAMRHLRGWDW